MLLLRHSHKFLNLKETEDNNASTAVKKMREEVLRVPPKCPHKRLHRKRSSDHVWMHSVLRGLDGKVCRTPCHFSFPYHMKETPNLEIQPPQN